VNNDNDAYHYNYYATITMLNHYNSLQYGLVALYASDKGTLVSVILFLGATYKFSYILTRHIIGHFVD